MKLTFLLSCIGTILIQTTMAQSTFYTRLASATDDWDNADRWTLTPSGVGTADGIPAMTDHIVILSGETVLINNITDNGSAGVSADGLNLYNVGPFIGSDVANFYQTGNITIESGGVLNITVRLMLEGVTLIEGTLNASFDVINLGQLESISGSTFTLGDDLILSGTGKTIIDNLTTIDDDLYIDHTEARLCGTGEINIGNEPLGAIINYLNGASILQVCSAFTITCTSTCDVGLPTTGTGVFTFDLNQFNYAKTITIDNTRVAGDLTNFPVLINYSNPSIRTTGDGGGISNSNGYDIIFATSGACGSVTQLDHQIESYSSNGTTGTLIAWVNVPIVEDKLV